MAKNTTCELQLFAIFGIDRFTFLVITLQLQVKKLLFKVEDEIKKLH